MFLHNAPEHVKRLNVGCASGVTSTSVGTRESIDTRYTGNGQSQGADGSYLGMDGYQTDEFTPIDFRRWESPDGDCKVRHGEFSSD